MIINFNRVRFSNAEEEASKLRFYVDEPAFTDLHWVGFDSSFFLVDMQFSKW